MAEASQRTAGTNWRRKWKRTPAHLRRQAAGSLADVFVPRRSRGAGVLLVLLVVAAVLHAGLLPFVEYGRGGEPVELTAKAGYLRKVVQKERAVRVARHLARRTAMPPPPPVPEAVVSETLSGELTTDIERVIGGALDVQVTSKLAKEVTASLRDELAAAARDIADGKLTAKEIRAVQDDFRRKAHRKTVTALRRHREATQVKHAKLSVREWYEQRVSRTLRRRIEYELFQRPHHRIWPGGWNRHGWDALHDGLLPRKVGSLGRLAEARHTHAELGGRPLSHGWRMLPDWPKPSATQAEAVVMTLRSIHERHPRGWHGSWADGLSEYLAAFYPHREKEAEALKEKLAGLWDEALERAEAYRERAGAGAAEGDLKAAQQAAMKAIRRLAKEAGKVLVDNQHRARCHAVNRAVRSRVLRGPAREAMHKRFVDAMMDALQPAMRDMARNEFREGIIIRRKGIGDLTRQFAEEIVALLRADVEKAFPQATFNEVIFQGRGNPYKSQVTGESGPPSKADVARDEKALAGVLEAWDKSEEAYVEARAEIIRRGFAGAVDRVAEELLSRLVEEGRMRTDFYAAVESVDYTDEVQQRLRARARAMGGRGQDLAKLTEAGVPDTSASMVALLMGAAKGHGVSLEPVHTGMAPSYVGGNALAGALRSGPPRLPPPPASWGRVTQPEIAPPFDSPRAEGIPFLANFPRIDGDLRDWGKIRPLLLRKARPRYPGPEEPIVLYAAWNYQGLFFGYHMPEPAHRFAHPKMWRRAKDVTGVVVQEMDQTGWAYTSDYFRMMFDTLDARGEWRGEPHTQEFVIFPMGTEANPSVPGIERIIKSTRDALPRGPWGGHAVDSCKIFLPQPSRDQGPDGTGPYRVTRMQADGYTVEIFMPRSLFNVPVFCPGWWIGFDCVAAFGTQPRGWGPDLHGKIWSPIYKRTGRKRKDRPDQWGDLLLLGTDPRLAVQDADPDAALTRGIVPGHSYLLTVIDPDRNIHLTTKDTVVISAEVLPGEAGGGGPTGEPAAGAADDVEVFVLTETGPNTSVFRGYVDTQPGAGRQVQAVIEALPGQRVRFGYVDLADAEGRRNVVYYLHLPVLTALTAPLAAAP